MLWRKQQLFLKLEKMRITRRMILFHRQNKARLRGEEQLHNKSDEQLTEISKHQRNSPNKSQVSIRKEEEEEKKMNQAEQARLPEQEPRSPEEEKSSAQREEEDSEKAILDWWQVVRKGFLLENALSIIRFLNLKLDGIPERDIEKRVP